MSDFTRLLDAASAGDRQAAADLLPFVYDELRRMAQRQVAHEPGGLTLQATALVHEAYLRLAGQATPTQWDGRAHFFAAAAEAMRRILVEQARARQSLKRGGDRDRVPLDDAFGVKPGLETDDVLAVHEALDRLADKSPRKAELVKLRYFLGCTISEAAAVLGIAPATAEEDWTFAKAWLRRQLSVEKP